MGLKELAFAAAAIGSVAFATPAFAHGTVLEPSSAWNLDYSKDSCVLRRAFGEGKQFVQLELRQFAPHEEFQVSVFGKPSLLRSPIIQYRFEPSDKWRNTQALGAKFSEQKFPGSIFSASLTERPDTEYDLSSIKELRMRAAAESAEAARVTGFSVHGSYGGSIRLDTGRMAKPYQALGQCLDELTHHWGIDVEAHQTLTRAANPTNLKQVPRMMDYPPKMLAIGMQGIVDVRLDVDANGEVSGCHIQMPLSDPAFQASTCADLKHALEFEPALDKDGKPIASYWTTRVVFVIG